MEKNEIQKTNETADLARVDPDSPAGIMMQLMSNGDGGKFDVDGFGKMLEYQERHEANKARKVFASDFAVAQSNIAAVVKTKVNPQTKSKYAGLDAVIDMAKPVYTKQGFSIIYYEGKAEKAEDVRVYADVLHKAGHKETYHLDVPLGGVGIKGVVNMTAIHAKATSFTYGRRYLLCNIWNIPTQDDDGNAPGKKPVEVKPPTDEEWGYIDEICKLIPAPDGKRVDRNKVAAICYESKQAYPYDPTSVAPVVTWLSGMDRPELFIPENRSQAEIDLGMPGDEDSRPDTEADKTAAAKFGEENDQVELRYYCPKCGKGFEEFKINGVCPNTDCLSRGIVDRQK